MGYPQNKTKLPMAIQIKCNQNSTSQKCCPNPIHLVFNNMFHLRFFIGPIFSDKISLDGQVGVALACVAAMAPKKAKVAKAKAAPKC